MLKVDKHLKDSLIADSISDQAWEYDLITGETNILDSLNKLLGYSKYEFRSHIDSLFNIIHNDDIENLKDTFSKVIEGECDYFKCEYRIRAKDNEYLWIKSRGKVLKNEDGRNIYLAGVHSETRKSNETKDAEQRYRKLFYKIKDIILLSDVHEDTSSEKFIEVNDVAIEMLGYSKEELLNMSLNDICIGEEDEKKFKRFFENVIDVKEGKKAEHSFTFETTLLKKDGAILPVEINANLFELNNRLVKLYVIKDISDRLITEEALIESTERNKKIIDLSPLGVYIVRDGIITYANKPGLKLFGAKNDEEVVGRARLDFIADAHKEVAKSRETSILNGNNVESMVEMELIKIDGSNIIGEVYSAPLSNKDELLTLAYINDVTEKNKMIMENKKLLQQTIEYDKLKTEFFGNISHEIRTPLNIIISAIQLLNSLHDDSDSYDKFISAFEKYIKIMKQNAYRLLRLINNIIDLTKIDSGFSQTNLENHNIVAVVEDITLSVADYIKNKDIELIFDTDIEEKIIACDEDKIERIMLNLLSNAIKYTKAGGNITVDIKDLNSSIMITVKDSGTGIPDDKINVIFQRFRQVDDLLTRRAEGSGIGLSLVKSFVEAHQGTISVNSTKGVGSEFIIILPCKTIQNTETMYKPLDNIHYNDQIKKKIETITIEFSDIYK